jgi:hypothetical protein
MSSRKQSITATIVTFSKDNVWAGLPFLRLFYAHVLVAIWVVMVFVTLDMSWIVTERAGVVLAIRLIMLTVRESAMEPALKIVVVLVTILIRHNLLT